MIQTIVSKIIRGILVAKVATLRVQITFIQCIVEMKKSTNLELVFFAVFGIIGTGW